MNVPAQVKRVAQLVVGNLRERRSDERLEFQRPRVACEKTLEDVLQDLACRGIVARERIKLFGVAQAMAHQPVPGSGDFGIFLATSRRRYSRRDRAFVAVVLFAALAAAYKRQRQQQTPGLSQHRCLIRAKPRWEAP